MGQDIGITVPPVTVQTIFMGVSNEHIVELDKHYEAKVKKEGRTMP